MKILSWNYRGFARAAAVRILRAMCRLHKPDVIFLCETKVKMFDVQNPLALLGFPLQFQVPSSGSKGGLVVACKFGFEAEQVALSNHRISLLVHSDPPSSSWLVTCAHAPSAWNDRGNFWFDVENIGQRFRGPWLLIGNFNAIISSAEKKGGRNFGSPSHNVFVDFVHCNGLTDLGYSGNPFTWNNKRKGRHNIKERLDRGLSNKDWIMLFPNAQVKHLPATFSDHNPLLLSTTSNCPNLPKPFKFEEFWTRDLSSHSVIASAWSCPINGSAAFSLSRKIKASKAALKLWNIQYFGNIHYKIKSLLDQINLVQSSLSSLDLSAKEESLHLALQEELIREESLWKQKFRELWLTSKDLNTKFFHASTAIRHRYNSTISIELENGSFLNNRKDIGLHFTEFFSNLFTSSNPSSDGELNSLFPLVISHDENTSICMIPEELEIL
jgi:hypothetical protein